MSENGSSLITRAISSVVEAAAIDDTAFTLRSHEKTGDQSPSPEALEKAGQLLQANASAVSLAQEAIQHEFQVPDSASDDNCVSLLTGCRRLSRLIELGGMLKEVAGDLHAAADAYLDVIALGALMSRDLLITALVGLAIEAKGKQHLWPIVDMLKPGEASAAARRLIAIQAGKATFGEIMRADFKSGYRKGLESDLAKPLWRVSIVKWLLSGTDTGFWKALGIALRTRRNQVTPAILLNLEALARDVELPFALSSREDWYCDDTLAEAVGISSWSLHRFVLEYRRADTMMLPLALGLQAHKADLGFYPETLNELAPKYLDSLPLDPFAVGEGFRYRRTEDRYLLYSVGPDGVDDGGVSVDFDENGAISRESKGDIVAWDIKPLHKPRQLTEAEREELLKYVERNPPENAGR